MSYDCHLNSRDTFMAVILSFLNRPYIWGGDDPFGVDCSGLVVEGLKAVGFLKENEDFTADGLYRLFSNLESEQKDRFSYYPRKLEKPAEGAIVFFFNSEQAVFHCSVALNEKFQIGAIGGDTGTTSAEIARISNAFVKIRPIKEITNLAIFSIF